MKSNSHLYRGVIPDLDVREVKNHLEIFSHNHPFIELRLIPLPWLPKEYAQTGIFDDCEKLLKEVRLRHNTHNAYIGLNPRKEILLHKIQLNCLSKGSGCSALDVAFIENILIDVEAIRPEKDIAATDEDLKNARSVFDEITSFLRQNNVSGLEAESGNGFHLVIACTPYAATSENELQIKAFLQFLGARFSNDKGKVDESVFDIPRITRLYGCANKKGMNTHERPWRISKMIATDGFKSKHDILSKFAAEIKKFMQPDKSKFQSKIKTPFNLVDMCKEDFQ